MSRFHYQRHLGSWLVFCLFAAGFLCADDTPIYKGPLPDLVEVPFIKTEPLEPMVARQIKGYQRALIKIANTAEADSSAIGRAYGMLGQAYHAYEWLAPARRCYLNAVQLNPKAFSWPYLLGITELELGNTEAAETQFVLAAQIRPDYMATYIRLGNIRLQFHDGDGAQAYFEKVVAVLAESPAAWEGIGRAHYFQKKYDAGIAAYEKAAKFAPTANKINYFIAMTYRAMNRESEARAYLKRAGKIGVRPGDRLLDDVKRLQRGERVFLQKGNAAFSVGRYQEALVLFEKALKSNPNSVPARINLGTCLGVLGNAGEAVAQFKAALSQQPDNVTAHYNLGKIYASARQFEIARGHLSKAASLQPEDHEIRFNLANTLISLEREDEAMALFDHMEQAKPDQVGVPVAKVNLLMRLQKHDQALAAVEKYRIRFPQEPNLAYYHCQLLVAHPSLSKRDGQRALDIALQLVEQQKQPRYFENVAMAHAELGNCARAAKWQAKAIELYRSGNVVKGIDRAQRQWQWYQSEKECRISGKP